MLCHNDKKFISVEIFVENPATQYCTVLDTSSSTRRVQYGVRDELHGSLDLIELLGTTYMYVNLPKKMAELFGVVFASAFHQAVQ